MLHRSRSAAPSCFEPLLALLLSFVLAFAGCDSNPPAAQTSASAAGASSAEASSRASATASAAAPAAAATASSSAAAEPAVATAQPFLWEVKKTGAGAETSAPPSYLFGTMHIGTDAEKELHPIVFQRLDAARAVFFEANVFDVDPGQIAAAAMLPPGQSVKSKLGPGHWQLLVDRVGGLLTPESVLERMKPWVLVGMLAQDMLPATDPMDKVMYERAKAANKQLLFVETLDEQVSMIENVVDAAVLDDMLADLPLAERLTKELADAYRNGDMDALMKATFDPVEMKKHPAMFDKLLYERNRRWIPKLVKELERGNVFVAVGAAHLVGDKSVTALLGEKGFALSRVTVR